MTNNILCWSFSIVPYREELVMEAEPDLPIGNPLVQEEEMEAKDAFLFGL